jgi:small subunit ribosomal protein S6
LLKDYEILYIVRPELDEEQLQEAVSSVSRLIENLGGTSLKTDVWGRRRLAYEVKHLREGQYVLTDFQIEPTRVPEIESTLKISDMVFRHLIVRKPQPKREAEKATKAVPQQPAAEAAETAALAEHPDGELSEPVAAEKTDEEGDS